MDRSYPELGLFVAGEWRGVQGRDRLPVVDPATAGVVGELPVATTRDLDDALTAANRSFSSWRAVSAFERAKILHRAANLLRERAAHIGRVTVLEQGKPLADTVMEANASADIFDWFAEEARRAYGRIVPSKFAGVRNLVFKEPVGVVAAFTPWNFPLTIPARKLGAALAAGCPVIIKAAEETPASCLELVRALDDAGLPKGVLNAVFGDPAIISEHLIASPVVRKLSFTGSTAVGRHLSRLAAQNLTKTTMELGGHAPVIVFEDADIERAATMMARAKYRNAGQICIAPTRFYVHDRVHDAFVDTFVDVARGIKVGSGLEPGTMMGPLANPRRLDAIGNLVVNAQEHGARCVLGGNKIGNVGNFWEPTVLTDVPDEARIMNEEPFGPVAVTQRFERFDEVVAQANRLEFGLAAYAFTNSVGTAAAIGEALEAGMVGVNSAVLTGPETPFGGVKHSGHGSEGGIEGLEGYLNVKYISEGRF